MINLKIKKFKPIKKSKKYTKIPIIHICPYDFYCLIFITIFITKQISTLNNLYST